MTYYVYMLAGDKCCLTASKIDFKLDSLPLERENTFYEQFSARFVLILYFVRTNLNRTAGMWYFLNKFGMMKLISILADM